jgi:hypothetical protein
MLALGIATIEQSARALSMKYKPMEFSMKYKMTLIAALTGIATHAHAQDLLAGGPTFQGGQTQVTCYYINMGTTSITPTAQNIYGEASTTPILNPSLGCPTGSPVAPKTTCFVHVSIGSTGAHSCLVTFSTAATNVRGALEVRNSSDDPIARVEMR